MSGEQYDNAELAAPPAVALAALEGLINRLLALDPEGAAGLAKVQGRVLRVELDGIAMA